MHIYRDIHRQGIKDGITADQKRAVQSYHGIQDFSFGSSPDSRARVPPVSASAPQAAAPLALCDAPGGTPTSPGKASTSASAPDHNKTVKKAQMARRDLHICSSADAVYRCL